MATSNGRGLGLNEKGAGLSREEEYKERCREAKERYHEEVIEHGDSAEAKRWRSEELATLDRQYREGKPMTGCGVDLR